MTIESAAALTVQRDRNGLAWISVDSLVDLFENMAGEMADGPAKTSLARLADTFRPVSTYAALEQATAGDDSKMQARQCPCGAVVIDARRISGDRIVINAEPIEDGELFPLRIVAGVPTVVPYRSGLDGVTNTRLSEHSCIATPRRKSA